ncbi:glycoside hydrolase family 19 protein [Anabaena sphaerica]|uniref:glycoside hydrolase family 19 protein n=1 Tax=Anabaena sphaerica TaxID=212446 RepID=UPI001F5564F8|nr:glycoside hydrolase family 19 protein [Anabaena sphaerica]
MSATNSALRNPCRNISKIIAGLECSIPTNDKVRDRVGFYERFAQMLGVSIGENVYCDRMAHY